jgi:hypothetical protein
LGLSKCFIVFFFFWVEERGSLRHVQTFVIFLKIPKQNSSLFAAERCKTVGTNRKTWFESQSLQYSHGKSVFLANVCSKTNLWPNFFHSSKLSLLLSPFESWFFRAPASTNHRHRGDTYRAVADRCKHCGSLRFHVPTFFSGDQARARQQVGNLSEHARRKSIWRHILGVFREFIWF